MRSTAVEDKTTKAHQHGEEHCGDGLNSDCAEVLHSYDSRSLSERPEERTAVRDQALPSHLISLIPSEWGIWRWFILRGSGFPLRLLQRLSEERCQAAADELISSEKRLGAVYEDAAHALNQALDALRLRNGTETEKELFAALVDALRSVRKKRVRDWDPVLSEFKPLIESILSASAEHVAKVSQFESVFQESVDRQSREVQTLACHPLLQEAVVWQNRQAFESGIKPIAHGLETARNKKLRQHEELVAIYLQRYCAKNDTIGFFGPVAWGEIAPVARPLEIESGASLVCARHTYFEHWAIDTLAAMFSSLPEMEWSIAPTLAPHCHFDGAKLHSHAGGCVALDELSRSVLSMCDGRMSAKDIVVAIQSMAEFANTSREEIRDLLHSLKRQGVLVWRLAVPLQVNSERTLLRDLVHMDAPEVTSSAIRDLERLNHLRNEVAAASGNADRLNSALSALESAYGEIAKTPGQKSSGEMYAGRTLVYEDCRRDLQIKLSPQFFEPVVPALELLLRSVRWLMHSTGQAFKDLLHESYMELSGATGETEVSAGRLWSVVSSRMTDAPPASIPHSEILFQQKWRNILQLPTNARSVHRWSHSLREDCRREFPEVPSSFHSPYYCPDLMISAEDADAVCNGKAVYVLGECHIGFNTLTSQLFSEQHPCVQDLVDAVGWDHPEGRFRILKSPGWEKVTTRTNEGVFHPGDFIVSATESSLAPDGFVAHPVSDLLVGEKGGRLLVFTRDQSRQFEILDAFSQLLCSWFLNKASWLDREPHTPRVTIDSLVIQRESWSVPVGELDFIDEKEQSRRFLGARRWMQTLNLPGIVFVKSPIEVKPLYLDLSSPIYVEIFTKMARRLKTAKAAHAEVSVSEMLPGVSGCWLSDQAGERYTSEIRVALVDLKSRDHSQHK